MQGSGFGTAVLVAIPITTFVLRREQGESWGMGLNARHEVGIRP